jgi:phosphatidyl-myo-inositol alpha-mannosyltransferase
MAVLEAMACGAVPIVPDVGDLREALDGGRAGVVIPVEGPEDVLVAAFVEAACALLDDEPRRAALATRAAAHVRSEHDPRRTAQEWRAILSAVLA